MTPDQSFHDLVRRVRAAGLKKPAAAMEGMRKDKELDAIYERWDIQERFAHFTLRRPAGGLIAGPPYVAIRRRQPK
jgi:hypothetical protein